MRSFAYSRDPVDEPVAVADAFGGDQRALGVQAVEDVLEALPFLADQVLGRDLEVVEEQLVGLVVDHVGDRPHRQPVADRLAQVDDEDRHAFGLLLHLGERRGARQQDHQVGVLHARDPDLLAVDDVAVALLHRGRLDLRGVGAGGRLGHAPSTAGAARRSRSSAGTARFCASRAVAQQRAHVVHLAVAGAGVAAGAVDLLHDHRGLGQARGPSRRTPAGSARPASRPSSARRRTPRDRRARSSTLRKYSSGNSAHSARTASRMSPWRAVAGGGSRTWRSA